MSHFLALDPVKIPLVYRDAGLMASSVTQKEGLVTLRFAVTGSGKTISLTLSLTFIYNNHNTGQSPPAVESLVQRTTLPVPDLQFKL